MTLDKTYKREALATIMTPVHHLSLLAGIAVECFSAAMCGCPGAWTLYRAARSRLRELRPCAGGCHRLVWPALGDVCGECFIREIDEALEALIDEHERSFDPRSDGAMTYQDFQRRMASLSRQRAAAARLWAGEGA